jgi:hypothetical protein
VRPRINRTSPAIPVMKRGLRVIICHTQLMGNGSPSNHFERRLSFGGGLSIVTFSEPTCTNSSEMGSSGLAAGETGTQWRTGRPPEESDMHPYKSVSWINFDMAPDNIFSVNVCSRLERKRANKAAVKTSAEIASSIAAWIVQRPRDSDHYSKNPGIYRVQLNFLSIPDEKDHFFGVTTSQPFAKGSLAHCGHHQRDFFPGVVGTASNELAIKREDDVCDRSKELARSWRFLAMREKVLADLPSRETRDSGYRHLQPAARICASSQWSSSPDKLRSHEPRK